MEVRVSVYTPWHLWTFLEGIPRVEIVYHSMHYVDLIRSFLGEPSGVHAKTVKHPATPKLAATRSNIILDYGDEIRASIEAANTSDFIEHPPRRKTVETADADGGCVPRRLITPVRASLLPTIAGRRRESASPRVARRALI